MSINSATNSIASISSSVSNGVRGGPIYHRNNTISDGRDVKVINNRQTAANKSTATSAVRIHQNENDNRSITSDLHSFTDGDGDDDWLYTEAKDGRRSLGVDSQIEYKVRLIEAAIFIDNLIQVITTHLYGSSSPSYDDTGIHSSTAVAAAAATATTGTTTDISIDASSKLQNLARLVNDLSSSNAKMISSYQRLQEKMKQKDIEHDSDIAYYKQSFINKNDSYDQLEVAYTLLLNNRNELINQNAMKDASNEKRMNALNHENSILTSRNNELYNKLYQVPRFQEHYLREAKKIVSVNNLELHKMDAYMRYQAKDMQSLSYWKAKCEVLTEEIAKLQGHVKSIDNQSRRSLQFFQSDCNANGKSARTRAKSASSTSFLPPAVDTRTFTTITANTVTATAATIEACYDDRHNDSEVVCQLRKQNAALRSKNLSISRTLSLTRANPLKMASTPYASIPGMEEDDRYNHDDGSDGEDDGDGKDGDEYIAMMYNIDPTIYDRIRRAKIDSSISAIKDKLSTKHTHTSSTMTTANTATATSLDTDRFNEVRKKKSFAI